MKIYWGLKRSHKKVLAEIDRLEHELGIDDVALLEARPKRRELPQARDLSHLVNRRQVISPEHLLLSSGAMIPVSDQESVQVIPWASSSSTTMVISVPKSKIKLPPGVRIH